MTITTADVKLLKSQVMDDVPEGGGARTANVIPDGASNTIFPDISEVDRAGGRVSMRKVFAAVTTTTAPPETYMGANVIVADGPDDPRVSVTIFSTEDDFDRRDAAKARLEAYLAASSEWPGLLMEDHLAGQRSIALFQRVETELPEISKTLCLVWHEGQVDQKLQYVRITRVTSVTRTFTDEQGQDYKANVVTCELSDSLRYDLIGTAPNRRFLRAANATKVRDTLVADATTYCGVTGLKTAATVGTLNVDVDSVFSQLVPSAQTEVPITDADASGRTDAVYDASNGTVSYSTTTLLSPNVSLSLGNPIVAGSLTIAYTGGTLTDDSGDLLQGTTVVGAVDYGLGIVTLASTSPSYSGSKTITAKVAGAPTAVQDTYAIAVTASSRSYIVTHTIPVPPAPKTLKVSYRSQGKWYDLKDRGNGKLKGVDSSFGAGTVSYITGTVNVTLGALPDVGSSILLSWGAKTDYKNRADMVIAAPSVKLTLSNKKLVAGGLTITWNDGQARTANVDANGTITGDATGKVNYAAGEIEMTPTSLPADGQQYTVSYSYGPAQTFTPTTWSISGGNLQFSLPSACAPGSVEVSFDIDPQGTTISGSTRRYATTVNGTSLVDSVRSGAQLGTVNNNTGLISLDNSIDMAYQDALFVFVAGTAKVRAPAYVSGYNEGTRTFPIDTTKPIEVSYRPVGGSNSVIETVTGELSFSLTPGFDELIVPGSIAFTLAGRQYFDRNGALYYGLNVANGSASLGGSVDYQTGDVTLTSWAQAANTVALKGLLTSKSLRPVTSVSFRVPVSPVRPGSLQILATKTDGSIINVVAATNGTITGTGVSGSIDYETGVVTVNFGQLVTAAGNEAQPWYVAANVSGGQIFRPDFVFASTIRFNATAYSYLPLDADLLGVDPVRLPQDGRVPIFRRGGFVVVGHTATTAPSSPANGATINVGRTRLSRVRVLNANGVVLTTGYTADLDNGTVTFTDVSTYAMPIRVEHRIEDMVLVSDVQISGTLSFTRPLSHDYPVGSYVSSALVAGDKFARVGLPFDQESWDGVTFSDSVSGAAAVGTYNIGQYPITTTNAGAETERWALQFTGSTTFRIVGEHLGVIGTGDTGTVCQPINPATGQPYFVLQPGGWGLGWAVGNILRFNTYGANVPVWVVRTVQQGPETVPNDSFTLLIRGDIDRP